jgi:hypothetical protein
MVGRRDIRLATFKGTGNAKEADDVTIIGVEELAVSFQR